MAAATYLSNKGVPFRKAHENIGNAVRLGLETNRELEHLTLDELRTISPEFGEDFFAAITLEATLDCHDVIGGTARTASQLPWKPDPALVNTDIGLGTHLTSLRSENLR